MKKINNKAFTLIELLAVIIILGVLMIIAIPSVTTYISNSRKSAYVNTAKQVIGSTRNMVNGGKLGMYDTTATYYVPTSCIQLENSAQPESPYGKFEKAYVVVTYTGQGYNYYWMSVDESGQGIKTATIIDDLSNDIIESNLRESDIVIEPLEGKTKIVEYSQDCKTIIHHEENAGEEIPHTTDGITWTYKDMTLSVDVHLTGCSIQGDYRVCYGATVNASNISGEATIKSFVASFDVPEGTVVINPGYTQGKLRVEVNGTRMTVYGNESGAIHNYINGQNETFSDGFQIKFPKDAEFRLKNATIDYIELISDIQEGDSSGNTAEDMSGDTSALHIRLHRVNMYPSGNGLFVEQYEVTVKNNTNNTLNNWSFTLEAKDGITAIRMYSQLQTNINGNTYTFTPYDWYDHKSLGPGEEVTLTSQMEIVTSDTNAMPVIK